MFYPKTELVISFNTTREVSYPKIDLESFLSLNKTRHMYYPLLELETHSFNRTVDISYP